MILNAKVEPPFDKYPDDQPLQALDKLTVKSQLSVSFKRLDDFQLQTNYENYRKETEKAEKAKKIEREEIKELRKEHPRKHPPKVPQKPKLQEARPPAPSSV